MRRGGLLWIVVGVAILLLAALAIPSDVLRQSLTLPWISLAGSERQLHATLLDVSQSGDPFIDATRRVLKPLGDVTLIRVYPDDVSGLPDQKIDPHTR